MHRRKHMTRKLVLVESPTKAKHISQFLGKDYTVKATKGYMFELMDTKRIPKDKKQDYGNYSINVNDGSYDMLLDYAHDHGRSSRAAVDEIRKAIASGTYDAIYFSTDPDRAGEGISYQLVNHLRSVISKSGIKVYRATWHEITKKAIDYGIAHAGTIDVSMAQADEARLVYDRLFGYSVSPYLWRVVASGTSGGRAQSPALRLVVAREKERLSFISRSYGSIDALFTINHGDVKAHLREYDHQHIAGSSSFDDKGNVKEGTLVLTDENMKPVGKRLKTLSYHVDSVTKKPYTRRPSAPYTTSTFQQDVGTRLGLSSKQLMGIAQKLFEEGIITYHRTDSIALSDEGTKAARNAAISKYGTPSVPSQARIYKPKGKNTQEGHEALRPATLDNGSFALPSALKSRLNGIDRKAYDVYTCIWNRTVASQMNDAKGVTTTINIAGGDADAMFASVGTVFSDLGWMRLTKPVNDSDDTNALPMVHEHDEAELVSLKPSMHDTEPPARFTEPQLVAKLEELGIGRPSTYASIVSVNQERGYVKKKGKAMYPTFRGMQVAQILESKLSSFVDYGYTANMETELDKIEHGSKKRNDFLDEIWSGKKGIEHNVLSLSKNIDWEEINAYSTIDLGNGYIVQVSRNGAWLQNPESPKNEQGFRTGAKLDDDAMVTDFMSVETCVSTLSQAADRNDNRELGILSSGPYKGWTVTVRDGKYGAYAQAVKPKATKKDKPVNMTLTEGMDMRAVTLDDIAGLFAETKLPRQLGEGFFTGIGKRGPWIGYKSKPRGKAKFKSLPDGNDPRTIELDTAKSIWNS